MVWKRGPLIGSGAFGTVHLGFNTLSGQFCAVKSVEADSFPDRLESLEKEILHFKQLKSDKIVQYIDSDWTWEDGIRKRNLMLEYMPGGSLSDIMKIYGGKLNEGLIRRYSRDILVGLNDMHSNGIVHNDIKGKNVVVGNDGAKICDLGAAERIDSFDEEILLEVSGVDSPREVVVPDLPCPSPSKSSLASSPGTSRLKGTLCWMAPELVQSQMTITSTFASDIWSVGCTVIEMATGKSPWGNQVTDPCSALYRIGLTESLPEFPKSLSAEGHDFLQQCLQRDPSKRPTAKQLLEHPFVTTPFVEADPEVEPAAKEDDEEFISPTTVLEADFMWDDSMETAEERPSSGTHRRSLSADPTPLKGPTRVDSDPRNFPAFAQLAAASTIISSSPKEIWKPDITLEIPDTLAAESSGSPGWWSSPGSPHNMRGNWIVVHSSPTSGTSTPKARDQQQWGTGQKREDMTAVQGRNDCIGGLSGQLSITDNQVLNHAPTFAEDGWANLLKQ